MTKGIPGCASARRNMILDRKTEMLEGMINIDTVGQLLKIYILTYKIIVMDNLRV